MDISLRHIEVFRAVMTAGSVSAAAELLRTSQPTASRELAALENTLGLKLFERVRGRLRPTAQAQALYAEVRRSYLGLERIVNAAQALRQFQQGQISIACLPVFAQTLLPRVCRQFLERWPEVSISIEPQESPLLEEWLSAQRHDLGLTEMDRQPPGTQSTLLFQGNMVCVLPDGDPLMNLTTVTPQDFESRSFVSLAVLDPYRQRLDQLFKQANIERRMAVETTSAASVCAMVKQGLGIAIVNPLTALAEAGHGVQMRRFSIAIPFEVYLLKPEFRPPSAVVEALASLLHIECNLIQQSLAK